MFRSAALVLVHVDALARSLHTSLVAACILMGGLRYFWSAHWMSAGLFVVSGKLISDSAVSSLSLLSPFWHIRDHTVKTRTHILAVCGTTYRAAAFWTEYILSHRAIKRTTIRNPALHITVWRTL
jgi:hypothetical protein